MKMYGILLVGFLYTNFLSCMQEGHKNYSAKCLIVQSRIAELCEEQSIITNCESEEIQAELQKLDEQITSHQTMLKEQIALPQLIQDASRGLQVLLRVISDRHPQVQSDDDWFWEE